MKGYFRFNGHRFPIKGKGKVTKADVKKCVKLQKAIILVSGTKKR